VRYTAAIAISHFSPIFTKGVTSLSESPDSSGRSLLLPGVSAIGPGAIPFVRIP